MPFQSTVRVQLAFGVPGELYTDGPVRSQSFELDSALASYNVFGRAFTVSNQGVAQAGGTTDFAGILVNPKASVLQGDGSQALNPSLTLPNFAQGELLTMGSIFVILPAPAAIGDYVIYDTTTGILSTIAPGADLPVGKGFAQAKVDYFIVSEAGLAVITVSPTLTIPQPA